VVNYDGSGDTTAALAFSGAGIEIANLQINCTEAIPAIYAPTADGCWIHGCVIKGDGTNCTNGIQINNCKSNIIEDNLILGCVTNGMVFGTPGTGDNYFINSRVRWNYILGSPAVGIYVDADAVATAANASFIHQNFIAGTATIGIHQDNAAAYCLIADNWIQATTAVTDDAAGAADNHTAS
jgi:hypothetical protein